MTTTEPVTVGPDPVEPVGQLAEVRGQLVDLLLALTRPPPSVRVEVGDVRLELVWNGDAVAPPAPAAAAPGALPAAVPAAVPGTDYLRSPTVGTFYLAKEPGAEPFVRVGAVVEPNQLIGIIEAMKLMMPIEADRAGRITAVLKGDGQPVEFDEPLFTIETGAL